MRSPPAKHTAYHELLAQFALSGCALCRLGARTATRYLEALSGELLLDPATRVRLRASLGFCRQHTHELDAIAPRLTVAILTEDWLQRAGAELEAWTRPRTRRSLSGPCSACLAVAQSEEENVRLLTAFLDDPEVAAAYEASSGLCLPHTVALCRRLAAPARERVITLERARLERLRAELAEVIRKHDYRFRDEPWGEGEKSAPGRAIVKIVGERPGSREE